MCGSPSASEVGRKLDLISNGLGEACWEALVQPFASSTFLGHKAKATKPSYAQRYFQQLCLSGQSRIVRVLRRGLFCYGSFMFFALAQKSIIRNTGTRRPPPLGTKSDQMRLPNNPTREPGGKSLRTLLSRVTLRCPKRGPASNSCYQLRLPTSAKKLWLGTLIGDKYGTRLIHEFNSVRAYGLPKHAKIKCHFSSPNSSTRGHQATRVT